ncbi:PP0621 family protein [Undibacterium arcticum]|uniref:PP0621 family protein n=1 Tax=Undibacterium arcticum TaxID=1762892 RepID=A0ABV7F5L9_9BURK
MRLLVWLVLGLLVYFALRSKLRSSGHAASTPQQPHPAQTGDQGSHASAEAMVICAHCGIYIPASEAISQSGRIFCSDEHRLLHRDS